MNTLHDVRLALRMLQRSPGFVAVAIVTLGLGIGAVTTIYGALQAVLLRPLPLDEPDRLVAMLDARPEHGEHGTELSYPNFVDYREQAEAIEAAGAIAGRSLSMSARGRAEYVEGAAISAELFHVLRVTPLLGRGFLPEEDRPGGPPVAVLAHAVWQSTFDGDSAVLGQTVRLNGLEHTVVGVMPPGFRFPEQTGIWTPLALDPDERRGSHYLFAVGRLAPGATVEQADAELKTIGARLAEAYPETNTGWTGAVKPLREELIGDARPVLVLMLGAVGFVLLIAGANIANLLLARSTARRREMGVRLALGAGRLRLMRQLLTESVLLALGGGMVGVVAAAWGLALLEQSLPDQAPYWMRLELDGAVLLFALLLSVGTGILFGLAPALQVSAVKPQGVLSDDGRAASSGRGIGRLRNTLVVAEVALSLVLLVGATLMVRSAVHLQSVHPGFQADGALTARLNLAGPAYEDRSDHVAFQQRLLADAGALPGVMGAAAVNELPLSGSTTTSSYYVEGQVFERGQEPYAEYRPVAGDFFATLGLPLLRGRGFTPAEVWDTAAQVAVINRTMAERWWPGQDPIGKRFGFHGEAGPLTVIGVVGDARHRGLGEPVDDQVYLPFAYSPSDRLTVVLRTARDPRALADELRATVRRIDADVALHDIQTLDGLVRRSSMENRLFGWLFGIFAALALLLASVGLYAVMSYLVGQRRHEIGIRVALGARAADVLGLVIGRGLRLTALGLAIGLAGAFGLTRLLSGLLYGVSATDPVTFLGVAATLATVALLASWVPARRAARIDPMVALRRD